MNLILLSPSDLLPGSNLACISGRRLRHVLEVLKPKLNDTLTVGLENGLIGEGRIVKLGHDKIELEVSLKDRPPAKVPAVLCCALMRPPVFRRVLQTAAAMGVRELHFFHSRRVEKSFWQSTSLRDQAVREELVLGLEQAKDTVFPEVHFHKRFKPFVEDVLPALLKDRTGIVE
jgi:RsmE family RNA methyltransferase